MFRHCFRSLNVLLLFLPSIRSLCLLLRDAVVMTTTTTPRFSYVCRPQQSEKFFFRKKKIEKSTYNRLLLNPRHFHCIIPFFFSLSLVISHVYSPSAADLVDGRACIDHGRESSATSASSQYSVGLPIPASVCVQQTDEKPGIGFPTSLHTGMYRRHPIQGTTKTKYIIENTAVFYAKKLFRSTLLKVI